METFILSQQFDSGFIASGTHDGLIFRGKYRIKQLIGRGGVGKVFLAEDLYLDRPVAIKFLTSLHTDDAASHQRFLREARIASRIDHPSVVRILDFDFTSDGVPYIVMEHLNEGSLQGYLNSHGPLAAPEALGVFREVLKAVKALHEAGILHRDIKPGNIMLKVGSRGEIVPVLIDFGLAINDLKGINGRVTGPGNVMGSPYYIAPELWNGEAPSVQSDIYALGCLLYHMITGQPPFRGQDLMETVSLHQKAAVPVLSGRFVEGNGAEELDSILAGMLDKSIALRYTKIDCVLEDLEEKVCRKASAIWRLPKHLIYSCVALLFILSVLSVQCFTILKYGKGPLHVFVARKNAQASASKVVETCGLSALSLEDLVQSRQSRQTEVKLDLLYLQALDQSSCGNRRDAVNLLSNLITIHEEAGGLSSKQRASACYRERAFLFLDQGRVKAAAHDLESCLCVDPQNDRASSMLIKRLERAGYHEQSRLCLALSLAKNPLSAELKALSRTINTADGVARGSADIRSVSRRHAGSVR